MEGAGGFYLSPCWHPSIFFLGDMSNMQKFFEKGKWQYYVTDDGEVLSTNRPDTDPKTWHRLAAYNGKGYRRVRVMGQTYKLHRLVAQAFVPNPYKLPYVLHIDGDFTNNHHTNLRWSSRQSNHGDI